MRRTAGECSYTTKVPISTHMILGGAEPSISNNCAEMFVQFLSYALEAMAESLEPLILPKVAGVEILAGGACKMFFQASRILRTYTTAHQCTSAAFHANFSVNEIV